LSRRILPRSLRNRLETFGFKIALGLLKCVPYSLAERSLVNVTRFVGVTLGVRKQVAEDNLKLAFPDKDEAWRADVIERMFAHGGRMVAEMYLGSNKRLIPQVRCETWHHMTDPLKDGHGVLLVSAHYGNWELAARYATSRGIPLSVIAKRQRNTYFDDYTNHLRNRFGIGVIISDESMRPLFERLRHNEAVCFLSDQDARGDGIRMDFFGHPASVHYGPVKLALRTGASIVSGYMVSIPGQPHELIFSEPIHTTGLKDTPENVYTITRALLDRLEEMIRLHPEQWFWVHKRWKGAHKAIVLPVQPKETQ
jgi:KDO2-lipid IV(A) lauroyltransferase